VRVPPLRASIRGAPPYAGLRRMTRNRASDGVAAATETVTPAFGPARDSLGSRERPGLMAIRPGFPLRSRGRDDARGNDRREQDPVRAGPPDEGQPAASARGMEQGRTQVRGACVGVVGRQCRGGEGGRWRRIGKATPMFGPDRRCQPLWSRRRRLTRASQAGTRRNRHRGDRLACFRQRPGRGEPVEVCRIPLHRRAGVDAAGMHPCSWNNEEDLEGDPDPGHCPARRQSWPGASHRLGRLFVMGVRCGF
jgi:hypothetical protein